MNLTDTKMSKHQLLDVFDALHDAVEALHKAHTIASRHDPMVASQLFRKVASPAAELILSVTGDLLEAARPTVEDMDATA